MPEQVLDIISGHGIPLYISEAIMGEVAGTLAKKFHWTKRELETLLPPLWERCAIIKPTLRLAVCSDPDDNHVLECAAACQAGFLITYQNRQPAPVLEFARA